MTAMPSLKPFVQHAKTDYLAFHPPLIRLQQTAPHPQGRRVLWALLALLAFLLVWALLGRLDIVAVADGKLVPASYLKIVQPSEAGIIKEILVREGEQVRAGQVLMRMDALITNADLEAMASEHVRKRLALTRIDAELSGRPFQPDFQATVALVREVSAQYRANRDASLTISCACSTSRATAGSGNDGRPASGQASSPALNPSAPSASIRVGGSIGGGRRFNTSSALKGWR